MKKLVVISLLGFLFLSSSFKGSRPLRKIYAGHSSTWPKPLVDSGVRWQELAPLPNSPIDLTDTLNRNKAELGKVLFFDPRLSLSGEISCASCHDPEFSWTDRRDRSLGHEGAKNARNSISIQNSWAQRLLFWDGRSTSLEDQAFAPINSETEMHSDMRTLPAQLRKVNGYRKMFRSAFGDETIDPDRIASALAIFQRTIISRKSRFDRFLEGDKKALSGTELKGLHLFRTKARCMNCHHGPLFTDQQFHNNGFSATDRGRYFISHLEEDRGKLKTPSLRDVQYTYPYMHDGRIERIEDVIDAYNLASFNPPARDPAIRPLGLSQSEKRQLLAFLRSISAPHLPFERPVLPD